MLSSQDTHGMRVYDLSKTETPSTLSLRQMNSHVGQKLDALDAVKRRGKKGGGGKKGVLSIDKIPKECQPNTTEIIELLVNGLETIIVTGAVLDYAKTFFALVCVHIHIRTHSPLPFFLSLYKIVIVLLTTR
jgi:hypothetical protein